MVLAAVFTFVVGVWLVAAAWVLDYGASGRDVRWNHVVVGLAVATLSLALGAVPTALHHLSWLTAVLGGWLVVAPFVVDIHDRAAPLVIVNDVLAGALVLLGATGAGLARADRSSPTPARQHDRGHA